MLNARVISRVRCSNNYPCAPSISSNYMRKRYFHNVNIKSLLKIKSEKEFIKLVSGKHFSVQAYSSTMLRKLLSFTKSPVGRIRPKWYSLDRAKDLVKILLSSNSTSAEPKVGKSNGIGHVGKFKDVARIDKIEIEEGSPAEILAYFDEKILKEFFTKNAGEGDAKNVQRLINNMEMPIKEYFWEGGTKHSLQMDEKGKECDFEDILLSELRLGMKILNLVVQDRGFFLSCGIHTNGFCRTYSITNPDTGISVSDTATMYPDVEIFTVSAISGRKEHVIAHCEVKTPNILSKIDSLKTNFMSVDGKVPNSSKEDSEVMRSSAAVYLQPVYQMLVSGKLIALLTDGASSTTLIELLRLTKDESNGDITAHLKATKIPSHKKGLCPQSANGGVISTQNLTPLMLQIYLTYRNLESQVLDPMMKKEIEQRHSEMMELCIRDKFELEKRISLTTSSLIEKYGDILWELSNLEVKKDVMLTRTISDEFREFVRKVYDYDSITQSFQLTVDDYQKFFGHGVTHGMDTMRSKNGSFSCSGSSFTTSISANKFLNLNNLITSPAKGEYMVKVDLIDIYHCGIEVDDLEGIDHLRRTVMEKERLNKKLLKSPDNLNFCYLPNKLLTIRDYKGDIISHCLITASIIASDEAKPLKLNEANLAQFETQLAILRDLGIAHGDLTEDSFIEVNGNPTITGYSSEDLDKKWVLENDSRHFKNIVETKMEQKPEDEADGH